MGTLTCQVRSRVWRDGAVVDDAHDLPNLVASLSDPSALVWVDLLDPSPEDLEKLRTHLDISLEAIEDVLGHNERPKVTRHGDHLFFLTYATRLAAQEEAGLPPAHGRLELDRVSGFVYPGGLVTIRSGGWFGADEFVQRWDDNPDLIKLGVGALVHGVLDVIVDGHFATISELDDDIEALEDELFDDRKDGQFLKRVYGVRKDLVQLRRVVLPMREEVNSLLRHRIGDDDALSGWYQDLYDHVLRAAEWTESLRDMVTTVFETNLSMQDTRLNTIMKKLAAWAAIIAVPTAVTGWFGQNIPYPGFQAKLGLWLSVGLIVGLSGTLYALFKRQDWL